MTHPRAPVALALLGFAAACLLAPPARAAGLDPRAITITLPDQIPWGPVSAGGNQQAVLLGDPGKPGPYIVLNRWLPGHMSRPHFHANDRFIQVLSGTWWVGTGPVYDPASTVAVPAGSFVLHNGKGIHYDGAKDEPCVLLISGDGPATSVPAERK